MTNEEAITMLKSKMDGHTDTSYEWTETVRMAVQALEQTRWIPVSERLPELGIDVLVCDMDGSIYLLHRSLFGSYFTDSGDKIKNIRAWMPLPEPYKESEEEE